MRRNPGGYTFLEVMTAIVIVVTIAGISFPLYQGFTRQAHAGGCASNLRQIGVGLNLYVGEHGMTMPVIQAAVTEKDPERRTMDVVLAEYVGEELAFRCPADDAGLFETTGCSYFWNSLLNGQSAMGLRFFNMEDDVQIPIASDKQNFHSGIGDEVNILYADGRVEKEVQFQVN